MLHEQQQEDAEGFIRGVLIEKPSRGRAELFDFVAVYLRDEDLTCVEMSIQRADGHACPTRDLVDMDVVLGKERFSRSSEERFAVAAGIGAQRAW